MTRAENSGVDSARAWTIVLAAFFVSFVGFGVMYTFGVFLKPMAAEFGASHAAMSALFSVMSALSFFLAPYTGDLADRFGSRPVVGCGALLMGAGLVLGARVHSFPLEFLTYGVGVGAGIACAYVPAIADVGEWFKVRRDLALGIAISGIGVGTLTSAPLAALLIRLYGWRSAFTFFGIASALILLGCASLLARSPIVAKRGDARISLKLRTRAFALLYSCILLCGIAVFTSFVYLPVFAAEQGASHAAAAALVGYIGAASVVGRLGLDALAPKFGLIHMFQIAFLALGASYLLWVGAHSYTSLVLFTIVMGTGYGGVAAMAPAVAALFFGIEGLGELLGLLFTGFGVASLVGPPLAGVLVDRTGDYWWPALLAMASAILALGVALGLRRYHSAVVATEE